MRRNSKGSFFGGIILVGALIAFFASVGFQIVEFIKESPEVFVAIIILIMFWNYDKLK